MDHSKWKVWRWIIQRCLNGYESTKDAMKNVWKGWTFFRV
jgi:hypothetical protein